MKRCSSMLVLLAVLMSLCSAAMDSSLAGSGSTSDSVSTPSSRNCTAQEITVMKKLYVGVAANTACARFSTVDKHEIYVEAPCNSTCEPVVQNLAESLPNCGYYLDGEWTGNHWFDINEFLVRCGQSAPGGTVYATFKSNTTITVPGLSSASGSAIMDEVSASSTNGSEAVGSDSSAAATHRLAWGVAALVAGVLALL
jgi:hypothetical protein